MEVAAEQSQKFERTCDHYKMDSDLPGGFKHPEGFKGYRQYFNCRGNAYTHRVLASPH